MGMSGADEHIGSRHAGGSLNVCPQDIRQILANTAGVHTDHQNLGLAQLQRQGGSLQIIQETLGISLDKITAYRSTQLGVNVYGCKTYFEYTHNESSHDIIFTRNRRIVSLIPL